MLDWLWSWIPAVLAVIMGAPVLFYGWRMVKAMLGASDALDGPADPYRDLRLAQARLRRLRTARYAAEHAAWSAEFSALTGCCSECAGPRRSASRYVPLL